MLALYGTLSFAKMDNVSVLVAQNLKFNMFWVLNIFFDEHRWIVESLFSFAACKVEHLFHLIGMFYNTHASATTARSCLDDNRVANFCCMLKSFVLVGDITGAAHCHRHSVGHGYLPCNSLVTHLINGVGGGPDEVYSVLSAFLGKVCILSQKAITGMESVASGGKSYLNELVHIKEYRYLGRLIRHVEDLAGIIEIHSPGLCISLYCNTLNAHITGCLHYSHGYLTAVGNKYSINCTEFHKQID